MDTQVYDSSFYKKLMQETYLYGKKIILDYFKDKQLFYGGEIPEDRLLQQKFVDAVLDTNMKVGIYIAYHCIDQSIFDENFDSIKLVVDILDSLSNSVIPKCFAAGMLLLCLEFCHGIQIDWTLINPVKFEAFFGTPADSIVLDDDDLEVAA